MAKFFIIFILVAMQLANAAESILPKPNLNIASMPIFYEDYIVRYRDAAAQTPVNIENPIDSNYVIGPGDFFEILLPNGNEGVQVSPEGTVAISGCGLIEVKGLKLFEAKQKIQEKLKVRYDQRFTGVHLVQMRRFVVNIQGAVWNPGQTVVSGQARVKSAVYSAGNFKPLANRDSVYIYRGGDTIATTENILLKAGDVIEIPYKDIRQTIDLIYTGKAITVPHIPKYTLKNYMKDAGISTEQNFSVVKIKYPEEGFNRWIDFDQINSFVPNPLCEIEFLMQAPFVYVGGAVMAVGKVPYNPSMHAADYVAGSGVTIITGNFSDISVLRNGKRISIDWINGEILPGDFIEIPRSRYERVKDATFFTASLLGVLATVVTIYMATH